jgi:hypothetical protein
MEKQSFMKKKTRALWKKKSACKKRMRKVSKAKQRRNEREREREIFLLSKFIPIRSTSIFLYNSYFYLSSLVHFSIF